MRGRRSYEPLCRPDSRPRSARRCLSCVWRDYGRHGLPYRRPRRLPQAGPLLRRCADRRGVLQRHPGTSRVRVPGVLTEGQPLILDRLRGVQRAGNGWLAFCPAHEDLVKRSLSVSLAEDGKTLLHCFARRCTVEQISRAVGLSLQDLAGSTGRRPTSRESVMYVYQDERGRPLYEVVRFEPKDYRPRRPDGRGGWIWGLGNVRRVLYRLDGLAEQHRIFLVE